MIYPDIVSFLLTQSPIINWDSAKKQAMQERFCTQLNYDATSGETKKQFFNRKICEYIADCVYAEETKESAITAINSVEKIILGVE